MHITILGQDPWIERAGRALVRLGHTVTTLPVGTIEAVHAAQAQIERDRPDCCLTRNFYAFSEAGGAELEGFLAQRQIPCACWFIDSPRATGSYQEIYRWYFGPQPRHIHFFLQDRTDVAFFRARGMTATHLPIAVDEALFDCSPSATLRQRFAHPVSFAGACKLSVDRPVRDEAELRTACITAQARMIDAIFAPTVEAFTLEQCQTWHDHITRALDRFFAAWYVDERAFTAAYEQCLADLASPLPGDHGALALTELPHYYSVQQMSAYLRTAAPHGLHVYGNKQWRHLLGAEATVHGPIDFTTELPALMAASTISLCLTKWQFRTAVHERPMLALACGGFPLTDYRADLDTMFEPDEIASFRSREELDDRLRFYLTHDAERETLRRRGRARIQAHHTYRQRMDVLIDTMRQVGAA